VDEEIAKEAKLKETSGILVTRTYPGAPGAKAGLKRGDVIVKLAGKAVKDSRELQTVVAGLALGKAVDIEVTREGKMVTLKVTIEEQPSDFGTARGPEPGPGAPGGAALIVDKAGLVITALTPELAESLGYAEGARGVVIIRVVARSVAGAAGLKAGTLILSVNRKPVTTPRQAADAIEDGSLKSGIALQVRGPGAGAARTVTLRSTEDF